MIALRSVLFNALFYLNLIGQMIVLTPVYFLLPRKKAYVIAKNWARSNHWLFARIVGATFEIEGKRQVLEMGQHFEAAGQPAERASVTLAPDTRGHIILGVSGVWMSFGILMMRNMINFDI